MVQPCSANSTRSDNPRRLIRLLLRPGLIGGTLFVHAVIDVLRDLEEYSTAVATRPTLPLFPALHFDVKEPQ
jgi:hypothetical protein